MALIYKPKSEHFPFRAPNGEIEDETRAVLRERQSSHFGYWGLTIAAIIIGAFGGSQLAEMSSGHTVMQTIQRQWSNQSIIEPAIGPTNRQSSDATNETQFLAAGDGNFYAEVNLMGVTMTMRLDPRSRMSVLRQQDGALIDAKILAASDVTILPNLKMAGMEIDNPAFVMADEEQHFSVIGGDLLSLIGDVDIQPDRMSIRPLL